SKTVTELELRNVSLCSPNMRLLDNLEQRFPALQTLTLHIIESRERCLFKFTNLSKFIVRGQLPVGATGYLHASALEVFDVPDTRFRSWISIEEAMPTRELRCELEATQPLSARMSEKLRRLSVLDLGSSRLSPRFVAQAIAFTSLTELRVSL